jgi:hypothetical protein
LHNYRELIKRKVAKLVTQAGLQELQSNDHLSKAICIDVAGYNNFNLH